MHMVEHNSDVYNPPYIAIFSIIHRVWKKISLGGFVYITVMFDHMHTSLVSLLFAVLVSLHPVTFLMFFITCITIIHSSPNNQIIQWLA